MDFHRKQILNGISPNVTMKEMVPTIKDIPANIAIASSRKSTSEDVPRHMKSYRKGLASWLGLLTKIGQSRGSGGKGLAAGHHPCTEMPDEGFLLLQIPR